MTFHPPVPRHLGRRWTARLVDWVLVLAVTSPVWLLTLGHVKHSAALETASVAGDGVTGLLSLRFGDMGDSASSGLAEVWGTVTSSVAATVLAQVLVVAAYDVGMHVWFGRTVGKVVTSLVVVPVGGGRRMRFGQAVKRTAFTVLLPALAWVAWIVGLLRLDVPLLLLGFVLVVLSVVECLSLRGPTCWHDRRSRTVVQPVDWAARLAALQNSHAWQLAQQAPGRVAERGRLLRERFGTGEPPAR
ncbi:RDD family protein [Actinosynnema sp. NPDC004786]